MQWIIQARCLPLVVYCRWMMAVHQRTFNQMHLKAYQHFLYHIFSCHCSSIHRLKMKQVLTAGSSGSICAPWSFSSISAILLSIIISCSDLLYGIFVSYLWERWNKMSCMVVGFYWRRNYGVNRWFFANGERALFLRTRAFVLALLSVSLAIAWRSSDRVVVDEWI